MRRLNASRMADLEFWLCENYPASINADSFSEFELEEQNYLKLAWLMPYQMVLDLLDSFYKEKPRKGLEVVLVDMLKIRFGITDDELVYERIKSIEKLRKYLTEHGLAIPRVQTYDELIRDNASSFIEQSGKNIVIRKLNQEEYCKYLLKKDKKINSQINSVKEYKELKELLVEKIEIIRALINESGFSEEYLLSLADAEREKNGSYDERILLKRTIEK